MHCPRYAFRVCARPMLCHADLSNARAFRGRVSHRNAARGALLCVACLCIARAMRGKAELFPRRVLQCCARAMKGAALPRRRGAMQG